MRKIALKAEERRSCYAAVNMGDRQGHSIDENLIVKIDILSKLKEGCTIEGDSIDFKTCNEDEILVFTNKQFSILVPALKRFKWSTVESASLVKNLVDRLEETPDEKDEIART